MTITRLLILGVLVLLSQTANATSIRSNSGATAMVAFSVSSRFQCLINRLDKIGYHIQFMGGFRSIGSVRGSLHPSGHALDINQYSRNVVRPRLPRNIAGIAASCGVFSGSLWRNADSGHFEVR